jgi:hypothetical protein
MAVNARVIQASTPVSAVLPLDLRFGDILTPLVTADRSGSHKGPVPWRIFILTSTLDPRVLKIDLSPPIGGARARTRLVPGGDDHGSCA